MLYFYINAMDVTSGISVYTFIVVIFITAALALFVIKWMQLRKLNHVAQKEQTSKQQRFRLEITEVSDNYVQTGLDVPKNLDGASIGGTLLTGLTIIGKKDPLILRMILLHTLDILSQEEDIKEALNSFTEKK